MKKSIIIRRFTVVTLLKIIAIGCFISFICFSTLMGFFALFGAQTVQWNHQSVTGLAGLIASPFIGALAAAIFTFFGWLAFAFSFWLFSSLCGGLKIDYISDEMSEG